MKLFGSYKKRSKKASMQLSINAIVILVMAMAVLGLGLGIVKGITSKKDDLLNFQVDLDQEADASNTIVGIYEDMSWSLGKEAKVGVSFYNKATPNCESEGSDAYVYLDCNDAWINSAEDLTSDQMGFEIVQSGTSVNMGSAEKLLFKITPRNMDPGSYACKFEIRCGPSWTDVNGGSCNSGSCVVAASKAFFLDV